MPEERACWLAWLTVDGVGPATLRRLQQHFGSLAIAWEANVTDFHTVGGISANALASLLSARQQLQLDELLRQHLQHNPHFYIPADPDYPRLLLEISTPPALLYYRGVVEREENWGRRGAIALVGTRSPSSYGRRWTRILTEALVQQGFTIVSGLAAGIDTEAHQSCLEAGGRTIAVVGTGVDVVYPWKNRALAEAIAEQGLIVSEYPAGTQPDRTHFPQRNRIIAGLCRAVIVVEAPTRSGALITAHLANDYGRDVYILPGSLDNPQSLGCLSLLNSGAQAILGVDHLLEMLGAMPDLDTPNAAEQLPLLDLDASLQQVLQVLSWEPVSLDWIGQQIPMAPGEISSALLQLELAGLVAQQPGMRYQRR